MAKRANPVARAVRTPMFRQRVVQDKRRKLRAKQDRRDMKEPFGQCLLWMMQTLTQRFSIRLREPQITGSAASRG